MKRIILFILILLPSIVKPATYYVALTTATPAGNDNNSGTINAPWATWEKAISEATAGDTVYFRGGVYYRTEAIHIHPDGTPPLGTSGTEGNYICYFGYPTDVSAGNKPIFDYSQVSKASYWNEAMSLEDVYFLCFKDLEFRNVWQKYNGITTSGVQAQGIQALYCANLRFERIVIHNIGGRAFGYFGGFTTEPGGNRIPSMTYDSTYIINCDAYDLCDSICTTTDAENCAEAHIGGWADGFKIDSWVGAYVLVYGCRAWHFGDNGFDISSSGHTVVSNCWAWRGGDFHFTSLNGPYDGEGTGIKYGGLSEGDTTTILIDEIKNCLSVFNIGLGFDENNSYSWTLPVHCHVFNNTSYANNIGFGNFSYTLGRTIRSNYINNISYKDTTYARGCELNCDINERFNSWDSASCSRPVLERIPISDADFVSLDSSQLMSSRKVDGSLPDITFLHLSPTSDAIDAGTDVELLYYDDYPDIGYWEYGELSVSEGIFSKKGSLFLRKGTINFIKK